MNVHVRLTNKTFGSNQFHRHFLPWTAIDPTGLDVELFVRRTQRHYKIKPRESRCPKVC